MRHHRSVVLATISLAVWVTLRYCGIDAFIQGDEGAFTSGTLALLAVAYGLFAAFLFATVWSEWVATEEAVRTRDVQKFLAYRDKRIPGTAKSFLRTLSGFLVAGLFLTFWRNVVTGGFSVFVVTFVVISYWELIMDLDDPFTGVWNVKVPLDFEEVVKQVEKGREGPT